MKLSCYFFFYFKKTPFSSQTGRNAFPFPACRRTSQLALINSAAPYRPLLWTVLSLSLTPSLQGVSGLVRGWRPVGGGVAPLARDGLHAAQPLVPRHRHQLAAGHRHQPVQAAGCVLGGVRRRRPAALHGDSAGPHRPRPPVDLRHAGLPVEEQHPGGAGSAG